MAAVTAPQPSRVPVPPVASAPGLPAQATIINVDLSSSGGSETSVDTGPLDVLPAAEQVEEVESLNTAMLQGQPNMPMLRS